MGLVVRYLSIFIALSISVSGFANPLSQFSAVHTSSGGTNTVQVCSPQLAEGKTVYFRVRQNGIETPKKVVRLGSQLCATYETQNLSGQRGEDTRVYFSLDREFSAQQLIGSLLVGQSVGNGTAPVNPAPPAPPIVPAPPTPPAPPAPVLPTVSRRQVEQEATQAAEIMAIELAKAYSALDSVVLSARRGLIDSIQRQFNIDRQDFQTHPNYSIGVDRAKAVATQLGEKQGLSDATAAADRNAAVAVRDKFNEAVDLGVEPNLSYMPPAVDYQGGVFGEQPRSKDSVIAQRSGEVTRALVSIYERQNDSRRFTVNASYLQTALQISELLKESLAHINLGRRVGELPGNNYQDFDNVWELFMRSDSRDKDSFLQLTHPQSVQNSAEAKRWYVTSFEDAFEANYESQRQVRTNGRMGVVVEIATDYYLKVVQDLAEQSGYFAVAPAVFSSASKEEFQRSYPKIANQVFVEKFNARLNSGAVILDQVKVQFPVSSVAIGDALELRVVEARNAGGKDQVIQLSLESNPAEFVLKGEQATAVIPRLSKLGEGQFISIDAGLFVPTTDRAVSRLSVKKPVQLMAKIAGASKVETIQNLSLDWNRSIKNISQFMLKSEDPLERQIAIRSAWWVGTMISEDFDNGCSDYTKSNSSGVQLLQQLAKVYGEELSDSERSNLDGLQGEIFSRVDQKKRPGFLRSRACKSAWDAKKMLFQENLGWQDCKGSRCSDRL